MIKAVTVTNHLGESILLELANPYATGLAISKIEGLGPGQANISMSDYASMDGSKYSSARLPARDITMMIQLVDSYDGESIEDVRRKCYRFFPIKKKIKLVFTTDRRELEIEGYVESSEADIFIAQSVVNISIKCPDPYFYLNKPQASVLDYVVPLFEFPFSNESLTTSNTVFGEVLDIPAVSISYDGDTEIGMVWTIDIDGPVSGLKLYNVGTKEEMSINTSKIEKYTGAALGDGDQIVISTVHGNKSVSILRKGIRKNIINCVEKGSSWLQLNRGENVFAFTATEGDHNIHCYINNKVAFAGV